MQNFERGKKPYDTLGIGNKELAKRWLKEQNITPSAIEPIKVGNSEVIYIDVDGDVWLDEYNLDDVASIPSFIKFRNVTGRYILGNKKPLI